MTIVRELFGGQKAHWLAEASSAALRRAMSLAVMVVHGLINNAMRKSMVHAREGDRARGGAGATR